MDPVERAEAELAALEAHMKGGAPQEEPQEPQPEPESQDPPPAPPAAPDDDPNNQTYKARWETLQGMFKRQENQIQQLMEQNQTLMERLTATTQQPPQPEGNLGGHLEELEEKYGEEFIEAVDAYITARIGTKLSTLEERINSIDPIQRKLEGIEQDRIRERSEAFQRELTQQMPDWLKIYQSDEFSFWAENTVEPFTGKSFADLFVDANNNWNQSGMLGVFKAFKTAKGLIEPKAPSTPPPPDPRASMVTPSGRGAGPAAAAPEAKIWKSSEVDAFWRNYDKYPQEQRDALELDIFNANREGRIVRG